MRSRLLIAFLVLALVGLPVLYLSSPQTATAVSIDLSGPSGIGRGVQADWSVVIGLAAGELIPIDHVRFELQGVDAQGARVNGWVAAVDFGLTGALLSSRPSSAWSIVFDEASSADPRAPSNQGYGPFAAGPDANGTWIDGPPTGSGYGYGASDGIRFVYALSLDTAHPELAWLDAADQLVYRTSVFAGAEGAHVFQGVEETVIVAGVPGPPVDVAAAPTGLIGDVRVSWQPPLERDGRGISSYTVVAIDDPSVPPRIVEGEHREVVFTGLDPTRVHSFIVGASSIVADGPFSAPVCTATAPWLRPLTVPLSAPCPLPTGWDEVTWASLTGDVPSSQVGTPGVSAPIATLTIGPDSEDEDRARLTVEAAGRAHSVGVYAAGLVSEETSVALLEIPPGDFASDALRVTVDISERFHASEGPCLADVETKCLLSSPVPPEVANGTLLQGGDGPSITIRASLFASDELVHEQWLVVPILVHIEAA